MTGADRVHPVAALFPMLSVDELKELADDIKVRGLLQPVVLDVDGNVLDGRNRLAACEMAGVEPTFTIYDGDDPSGYALAVNIARRHMSTGARAMVAEQARRLNGKSMRKIAGDTDLYQPRLAEAALVLDWCDATVHKRVIAGDLALSVAVEDARRLKKEDAEREAKRARLRAVAVDLLSIVDDERMSLNDAIAALDAREEKARQEAEAARVAKEEARRKAFAEKNAEERKRADERRDAMALLERICELVAPQTMGPGFVDAWAEHLGDVDSGLIRRTKKAAQTLTDLIERIER